MILHASRRLRNICIRVILRALRIFWPTLDGLLKRIEQTPGIPVPDPSTSYWIKPPSSIATHGSGPNENPPAYADVVIIGSGITGTGIARTILDWQRDHSEDVEPMQLVMLEARDVCSGATGRNGGHITPLLYAEYTGLKRDHGVEMAKQIIRFRLSHLPQLLVAAAEEGLLEDSQCREVQTFDVYHDQQLYLAAKRKLATYRADMPAESMDFEVHEGERTIQDLHLSSQAVGCFSTRAGAVHPYRFVTGILARLLREYSASFRLFTRTPCTDISSFQSNSSEELYRVSTPKGVIQTPHVVHATNGWTSHLLPAMRGKITPARGVMSAQVRGSLGKTPAVGLLGKPYGQLSEWWAGARSFVLFPEAEGHTYDYLTQQSIGKGDHETQDTYPTPCGELMFGGGFSRENTFLTEFGNADDGQWNIKTGEYLKRALGHYFNHHELDERTEDRHVKGVWSGILGISSDGMPWVGRIPTRVSGRRAPRASGRRTQTGVSVCDEKSKNLTGGIASEAISRLAAPGEWIAAGYSGEGMVHAWMSGKALAYMILGLENGTSEWAEKKKVSMDLEEWFPKVYRMSEDRYQSAVIEDLMVSFFTS